MKHTDQHKFNLIETSDTFSPEPLNQNMETLETALAGLSSRNDSGDSKIAALDKRITTLEGHRFFTGTFTGQSGEMNVYMGVTPKCAILGDGTNTIVLVAGTTTTIGHYKAAEIRSGGVYIYSSSTSFHSGEHPYIAFI